MTSTEPIDLETFKFEEDLYGEQLGWQKEGEGPLFVKSDEEPDELSPQEKRLVSSQPRRRNPTEMENEDRVLVSLVDQGWSWE
jgi:hypothetical protein